MSLSKAALDYEYEKFIKRNADYLDELNHRVMAMAYSEVKDGDLQVFANEFITSLNYPKLRLWNDSMALIDVINSVSVTAFHMSEVITKLKDVFEIHKDSNNIFYLVGVTTDPSDLIRVKLYLER